MGFALRARPELGAPTAIAIDLGTACCRVGVWRDGDVEVIPNERGKLQTPCCLAFTEHSVLVGESAYDHAEVDPENVIFAPQCLLGCTVDSPWVKRHFGDRGASEVKEEASSSAELAAVIQAAVAAPLEGPLGQLFRKPVVTESAEPIGNASTSSSSKVARGQNDMALLRVRSHRKGEAEWLLSPEEAVTLLLEHLRKQAERFLGYRAVEAVLTVPARFGLKQREALLRSCHAARLRVLALLKAPTAAAISFAAVNPPNSSRLLVICDVGATFLDFCLVRVSENTESCKGLRVEELACGTELFDLDAAIVAVCVQDLRERFKVSLKRIGPLRRLRLACEKAKRALTQRPATRVEVADIVPGMDYAAVMNRDHFEEVCRKELLPVLGTLDWCLEEAGVTKEVDAVLVGGGAKVPAVQAIVQDFFHGAAPLEVLRPEQAAVLGAAVLAASLSQLALRSTLPSSLAGLSVEEVSPWSAVSAKKADGDLDEVPEEVPVPTALGTRHDPFSRLARGASCR